MSAPEAGEEMSRRERLHAFRWGFRNAVAGWAAISEPQFAAEEYRRGYEQGRAAIEQASKGEEYRIWGPR